MAFPTDYTVSNVPQSNFNWGGLGSALGGIGSGLMGLFGSQKNPADAAMPYMNKVQGINEQYLNPYNQGGINAMNQLSGSSANAMNNPGGMINQMGQDFHQSPGFQFALNQALQGANHAAAAGGMAGSPQSQQANMGIATQLGNQDYYNWLNQAQNMYGLGQQGQEALYGGGLQAGQNLSDNISQALMNQANLAYQGQAGKNEAQGNAFSNLLGGVGSLFGL